MSAPSLPTEFLLSLKDRAEAVLTARDKLARAYAAGDDDPMTDDFKWTHLACTSAESRLAEVATPQTILDLVQDIALWKDRAGI